MSIKKSLQRVWLSKVCSKLDENSFPQLNEKLFSDTLYASKDYPCLQCGLHFIFVCDSLTPFSLTIQNESSLQVLMHRSIVEMKIEVILMSFSNIYFLKKNRICSYFSLILPERFWIFSELALKPTVGSHEIACYHQCSLQNELGLI